MINISVMSTFLEKEKVHSSSLWSDSGKKLSHVSARKMSLFGSSVLWYIWKEYVQKKSLKNCQVVADLT